MVKYSQKSASSSSRKSVLVILLILAAAIGLFFIFQSSDEPARNTNTKSNEAIRGEDKEVKEESESAPSSTPIPASKKLVVPFTPQAPTANWDELHNEACEEASVIMAWAYFNNITSLPASVVEREISKLTDWQKENYGYYLSITTEETARMAREVYGLKTEIVPMTETTVKRALTDGKLVILPAQGQMLGNPNFTGDGPPYHMLVITGYNGNNFVTNDPGTRKGKDYPYSYATLEDAAGSYSQDTHVVDPSEKFVILVSK